MSLTNNNEKNVQTVVNSSDEFKDFEIFTNSYQVIKDNIRMLSNIQTAMKRFEELKTYDYDSFNTSIYCEKFEDNINKMKKAVLGEEPAMEDVIRHYSAAKECSYIYQEYRRGIND